MNSGSSDGGVGGAKDACVSCDDDCGRNGAGVEDCGTQGQIGEVASRAISVGTTYIVPGCSAVKSEEDMASSKLGMDAGDAAIDDGDALGVGGVDGDVIDRAHRDTGAAGGSYERGCVPCVCVIQRAVN